MPNMSVLSEILMFFLRMWNLIMFGALLFCRRIQPRKHIAVTILLIVGYFTIFELYSLFISPVWSFPLLFGWLNPVYFIAAILCFCFFIAAFKVSGKDTLFIITASVAMQHLNHHVGRILYVITQLPIDGYFYRLIYIGISALVYFLFDFFLIRRMDIANGVNVKEKNLLTFAFISVILSLVVNQYAQRVNGSDESFVYSIAMLFGCLCILLLMLRAFLETQAEFDKKIIETILKSYKLKQEYSKEAIELVNRKYHDICREIAAVRAAGANGGELDRLEEELNIYGVVVNTGNRVLDALLAEKILLCNKNDIIFTYVLKGEDFSFIAPADLYCMLGNALDNAIEYLATVAVENRIIALNSRMRGNILFIGLENWIGKELEFYDNLPVTTKSDKSLHGYGVKSIRYIAEKYGGSVAMVCRGDRFCVDLVLGAAERAPESIAST